MVQSNGIPGYLTAVQVAVLTTALWSLADFDANAAEPSSQKRGAPAMQWQAAHVSIREHAARRRFAAARQVVDDFLELHPAFGPAYEARAWLIVDEIDWRDQLSFPDAPLARRALLDPSIHLPDARLLEPEGTSPQRMLLLSQRFFASYKPPRELDQALRDAEEARNLTQGRIAPASVRAFVAEFLGVPPLAQQIVDTLAAEGRLTSRDHLTRARLLRRSGQWAEALAAADEAAADPAVKRRAQEVKIHVLGSSGRVNEALQALDEALQADPDDPGFLTLRANLRAPDSPERFIEQLDRALADDPDSARLYFERGKAKYATKGDVEATRADLDRAIALDRASIAPLFARAWIGFIENDWKQAIEDFDRAIAVCPYFSLLYECRARALEADGQTDKAERDHGKARWLLRLYELHEIAATGQPSAKAWIDLGRHYSKGDDWQPAVEVLTLALKQSPENDEALRARAVVQQRLGRFDMARADADQAVAASPNPANRSTRGEIALEQSRWQAAIDDLESLDWVDERLVKAYRGQSAEHTRAGRRSAAAAAAARADELAADLKSNRECGESRE